MSLGTVFDTKQRTRHSASYPVAAAIATAAAVAIAAGVRRSETASTHHQLIVRVFYHRSCVYLLVLGHLYHKHEAKLPQTIIVQ